jgi:hypothetical protein
MGSNILLAYVIAVLCSGIALAALGFLLCGIWLWRKRRWLSLVFLIPSGIYLVLFLYVFIPRPLPHHILTIDLRRPTDLSGIPAGTKWFSDTWPAPRVIVPLSASGGFCCVEGRVDMTIILPDGQTIHDTGRQVYINTDDTGIWKILIDVDSVMPKIALENIKASLFPIAMGSQNKEGIIQSVADIENGLTNYRPNAPLNLGFRWSFPSYKLDLNLGTTFIPSQKVSYFCQIELPHVPQFERFMPLPIVDQPDQLVQDCRQILNSGAIRTVPKEEWPSSISRLKPSSVYVNGGNILLLFDSHAVTGTHAYAVGLTNQLTDLEHIRVISTPYPDLNEVQWHN